MLHEQGGGKAPAKANSLSTYSKKQNFKEKVSIKRSTWSQAPEKLLDAKSLSETMLRATVVNALDAAKKLGAKSIAFPAISTGMFNYPVDECGRVMIETCVQWAMVQRGPQACSLENIRLMNIDDAAHFTFQTEFKRLVKHYAEQKMLL